MIGQTGVTKNRGIFIVTPADRRWHSHDHDANLELVSEGNYRATNLGRNVYPDA
jgi:hypothetical protein